MVESWSHMMYTAEDHFLNFMEDVTDPGHHDHHDHHDHHGHHDFHSHHGHHDHHSHHGHHGHHSHHDHHNHQHRIDHEYDDPQTIYFDSIEHYDDHGNREKNDFHTRDDSFLGVPVGTFDTHRYVSVEDEGWTEDVNRMTNPIGFLKAPPQRLDISRYVPVGGEEQPGAITRMTNIFGFHDSIPDAEKIRHLNAVLGGTRPYGTHNSQAALGAANDLTPPHEALHPQPHTLHHSHSQRQDDRYQPLLIQSPFLPTRGPNVIIFEDEQSPLGDGLPHPRFRPSPLVDGSRHDQWVAGEHPGVTLEKTDADARETNQTTAKTDDKQEQTTETTTTTTQARQS